MCCKLPEHHAAVVTCGTGYKLLGKSKCDAVPSLRSISTSKVFNAGPAAKRRGLSAGDMAAALEDGLVRNGWFVTGKVDASLFSDEFYFEDPQVGNCRPPLRITGMALGGRMGVVAAILGHL